MTEASPGALPAIERTSVIIPARNEAGTIGGQLAALAAQDFEGDWEVVVCDNGSTDGTADVAARWHDRLPKLIVVGAADRPGINHARNVGAAAATGDYLVFCDADDEVTGGWLSAMVEAAATCHAVGGARDVVTLNEPHVVAWRGEPPTGLPTGGFLPYALGSSIGVRRAAFDAVGGFDESYVLGGDDLEFSWRLQLSGYQLCHAARAVVRYRYRSGLRSLARQQIRFGMARVQLYRDFRSRGMPRRTAGAALRTVAGLLVRAPVALVDRDRRGAWVRVACFEAGMVLGSVRYRVFHP